MSDEDPFLSPGERYRQPVEFEASYPGTCTDCGDDFEAGDLIRADGYGEWECAEHAG